MKITKNKLHPESVTDIYTEDRGMTSIVSYPERCGLWGNAGFRGNCDGRLFKNLKKP